MPHSLLTAADLLQTVWGTLDIGDAMTRLGVFKILGALQVLMRWAHTEYRPWYIENALPP